MIPNLTIDLDTSKSSYFSRFINYVSILFM